MLIILILILVVLFAFVQQINNNLYVLDILCLDNFYFAGVPQIILLSRIPQTHNSLPARTAPALAHQELSRAAPCCVGSRGTPAGEQVSTLRHISCSTLLPNMTNGAKMKINILHLNGTVAHTNGLQHFSAVRNTFVKMQLHFLNVTHASD